jgi:hypothetical protein
MAISSPGSGRKLQLDIALTNVFVGFRLFYPGCVDDLVLVDNRRVARKAKAKMHTLFGWSSIVAALLAPVAGRDKP